MSDDQSNLKWYFAEDPDKNLRQVVLCVPQGMHKASRFGTLLLSANYRHLTINKHGAGFFRLDSDQGPFLLTRLDDYTGKLIEGDIKIAFSFFRTQYGGLVGIYVGMESGSLREAFGKPNPFLEMINGLDERDTTVKLYQDAFTNNTLVVTIADRSMSTTSFYDTSTGQYQEATSPQAVYDIDLALPLECRQALQEELASVLQFHDDLSAYSRDYRRSVQCVYDIMPMEINPVLPENSDTPQSAAKKTRPDASPAISQEPPRLTGINATVLNDLACPIVAEGKLNEYSDDGPLESLEQAGANGRFLFDKNSAQLFSFDLKDNPDLPVIDIQIIEQDLSCDCVYIAPHGQAYALASELHIELEGANVTCHCPIENPERIALSPCHPHVAIADRTELVIYDYQEEITLGQFPVPNSYSGSFEVFYFNDYGDLIAGQYASQMVYRFSNPNEYHIHLDMYQYGMPGYCCHHLINSRDRSLWCSEMMSPILLWVDDQGNQDGDPIDLSNPRTHQPFFTLIPGDDALNTIYLAGQPDAVWKCDRKQKTMQAVAPINFEAYHMALLSQRYLLAVSLKGDFVVIDLQTTGESLSDSPGLTIHVNGQPPAKKQPVHTPNKLQPEPEPAPVSTKSSKKWWQFWK